jgi:3-isopropylmalate/(R)-2-methylmalate dehydratase small subunit
LPKAIVDELMEDAGLGANARLTVDLEAQTITRPNGEVVKFDVDPFKKHNLLNGLDDIGLTMSNKKDIDGFEGKDDASRPWMPSVTI